MFLMIQGNVLGVGKSAAFGNRLLLDKFPGAAVAYALLPLSKNFVDQPLIRVRRSSDNTERDFTYEEIQDNTLLEWSQSSDFDNMLLLDEFPNATSAYSLRNLSVNYNGPVIRARRTIDDTEATFIAKEITDGTLEDWTTGKGFKDFRIVVNTENSGVSNNDQFQFTGALGNYDVDVYDETGTIYYETIRGLSDEATITIANGPGIYELRVFPAATNGFNRIQFNNTGDRLKLLEVRNWGEVVWSTMRFAFWGCSNVTSMTSSVPPDLSNANSFFYFALDCTNLTTIDVSNWDVSNILDLNYCFYRCSSLTTLDVSNWDVSNATGMLATFFGCSSLTTLDVSNWNTASATTFNAFASGCSSLTTLDVSNWNTASVTTISGFTQNCSSLTTLDVSNWNTASVTTFIAFASGCSSLTTLDLSNWNTASATTFNAFASGCSSLTDIVGIEGFNISSVTDFNNFLFNVTLPTSRYDALLINYEAQAPNTGLNFRGGNSKYTAGGAAETARQRLIDDYGWNINDGGAAVDQPPSTLDTPTISGLNIAGNVLTVDEGLWSGSSTITFTYQWKRDNVDIVGATSANYILTVEDAGTDITCDLTATNAFGSVTVTSNTVTIEALTGLLDEHTGAAVAFAIDSRLYSSYTGPSVRVRRDLDNAERDFTPEEINNNILTNWVNGLSDDFSVEDPGLLDGYEGAAVAYALDTHLYSSYTGPTIRVRRDIDNEERDFTPDEINNGSLLNWTYGLAALPSPTGLLDDYKGSAFAMSPDTLLYSTYSAVDDITGSETFGVEDQWSVAILRDSDDAIRSFTPIQITDGTALTWVNELGAANGFVRRAYDQSVTALDASNLNHADQPVTANMPKLFDSSTGLILENGKAALDFDGVDDYLTTTSVSLNTNDVLLSIVLKSKIDDSSFRTFFSYGGYISNGLLLQQAHNSGVNLLRYATHGAYFQDYHTFNSSNGQSLVILQDESSGDADIYLDGVSGTPKTISALINASLNISIGRREDVSNQYWYGNIQELIFYPSDQSTNRIGIETAINNEYSIYNTSSAYVTKWYDQSGNGNDAVQTTASSQPKIVDEGQLILENGKAGIDFLGESSIFLDTGDFALISQPVTTFAVIADEKQTDTFRVIHSGKNSNKLDLGLSENGSLYAYSTQLGVSSKNFNNQQAIAYLLANGASSQLNKNNETPEIENIGSSGTQVESLRIGTAQFIAFGFQGLMQALLFFPSDQSTNRNTIESAINSYYNIYTPTNNGYVTTWYDQSGNANHATQSNATNQPKIVSDGQLILENGKAAIEFDGVNDDLNISVPITSGFSFFGIYKNTQDGSYLLGSLNAQFGRRGTSEYRFHVTGSFSTNGGVHSNNQVLFTGIEDTVNATIYANGIQQSQAPSVFSSDTLTLISRAGIVGNIQEIIIFDSDQSTNRTGIETAINNEYNIYTVEPPTDFRILVDTTQAGVSNSDQFNFTGALGDYDVEVYDSTGNTLLESIPGLSDNATITISNGPGIYELRVYAADVNGFNRIRFNNTGDKLKLVEIRNWGDIVWSSMSGAFEGCTNLVSVTSISLINLSNVTSLTSFVNGCNNLITLDVSDWDVSNVASFDAFANACTNLTKLDVSKWNTASAVNFELFVRNCTNLTILDVSSWDTTNVTSFILFAAGCNNLIDIIGIDNFNISSVTNFTNYINGVTLPTNRYNSLVINYAAQVPNTNLNFHGGNSAASIEGIAARNKLIDTYGWTITDGTIIDAHVTTWYDQSGNVNATQTIALSQPKIVEDGLVVLENNQPTIKFDGVDDFLTTNITEADNVFVLSSYTGGTVLNMFSASSTAAEYVWRYGGTILSTYIALYADNAWRGTPADSYLTNTEYLSSWIVDINGKVLNIHINQALGLDYTYTENKTNTGISIIGSRSGGDRFLPGNIKEFVTYSSAQGYDRAFIESNINEHYNLFNKPSGHVTIWYDQSGNGNNAVQNIADFQPKVVDAGSLVIENNKNAMTKNDKYFFALPIGITYTEKSVYAIITPKTSGIDRIVSSYTGGGALGTEIIADIMSTDEIRYSDGRETITQPLTSRSQSIFFVGRGNNELAIKQNDALIFTGGVPDSSTPLRNFFIAEDKDAAGNLNESPLYYQLLIIYPYYNDVATIENIFSNINSEYNIY